ncbi:MAG TPA: pitrilysin family protein [Gemmatimonadaceae bacterium]|nr:pitrilysin family protein [Gemmatimonadaceae bacterium]
MMPRLVALALAATLAAGGASDAAAAAPRPHVPPPDTLTTSFDVSGVHVILRRNAANDVVAVNLYLLGGTRGLTDSTVGIAPMMLWVSERGTEHYSREALRLKTAELGSSIVVEPQPDWTMFGFRGIRSTFDSTWMLFADRLMHPTLDSSDVELTRSQVASGVSERRDSPDDWVEYLADSVAFAGTPYGLAASGTERSIASISAQDLRRFRDTALVTSRMLVVVVGNVDSAQVSRDIQRTLGTLPAGAYHWTAIPSGMSADTSGDPSPGKSPAPAVLEQRSLPTNYILGYYNGPAATSPDYQALRVATAVLSGRLFAEVRSRRNLTYAVEAPFLERAVSAGGLYVTTVYPDSVLAIMREQMQELQHSLVDVDNLHVIVAQFLTEYFLNNETNDQQANFLARAQLYRGDWHAADDFAAELERVTPGDVQRAARRYMHDVKFAYLGDTTRVSRSLLTGF